MRNSYLVIPLFLIAGCKFNSFYEANISCNEWKEEGGTYIGFIKAIKENEKNKNQPDFLFKDTANTFPMRKCQSDKETNQILGFNILNREKDKRYFFNQNQRLKDSPLNMLDQNLKWEISKRFKY